MKELELVDSPLGGELNKTQLSIAKEVRSACAEVAGYAEATVLGAIRAGGLANRLKATCRHGEWTGIRDAVFGKSHEIVSQWMRLSARAAKGLDLPADGLADRTVIEERRVDLEAIIRGRNVKELVFEFGIRKRPAPAPEGDDDDDGDGDVDALRERARSQLLSPLNA